MRRSVSLTDDDVAFVDGHAAETGNASRSAVIHQAINLLREADLARGPARRHGPSGRRAPTPDCGGPRPPTAPPMRRGDLSWIDLAPVRGSEADEVRPAVVVSTDAANTSVVRSGRGVITVVPVTSDTNRALPFQVFLNPSECGLGTDSKAQAEEVTSRGRAAISRPHRNSVAAHAEERRPRAAVAPGAVSPKPDQPRTGRPTAASTAMATNSTVR